jgi:hypothetical protein
VIFADSHGKVTSFSLDKRAPNGNFVGPTGSVLSLDVHKSQEGNSVLACVGLDRFLRVFDISTRTSVGNIYCETKMTSVLVIDGSLASPSRTLPSAKRRKLQESSIQKEDNEGDSLWAKLPEISSSEATGIKRRRLRVPESRANAL